MAVAVRLNLMALCNETLAEVWVGLCNSPLHKEGCLHPTFVHCSEHALSVADNLDTDGSFNVDTGLIPILNVDSEGTQRLTVAARRWPEGCPIVHIDTAW
jgi:hypothetical protein